jgi:predicted transcriptional regulator
MSTPVVTVDENTDTGEIARLLAAHRIKRVPVVRNGQVVGIVSRENLLRALADQEPRHDVKPKEGIVERALADALAPLTARRSSTRRRS